MPEDSYIYLTLLGDFDPEEVAAEISIEPWQSYKRHSKSIEHRIPRVSRLSYGKVEVNKEVPDIYDMSEKMVDILEPYTLDFQRAAEKFDLKLCCSTCLWMMHDLNVSTPPIGFSKRVTQFIAAVGASIDVDTYRDDGNTDD